VLARKRKRLGRGPGSGTGKTSGKGTKVNSLVQVAVHVQALKGDNFLSSKEFLKEDLKMLTVKNTLLSIFQI
jgi:hypothetical protein